LHNFLHSCICFLIFIIILQTLRELPCLGRVCSSGCLHVRRSGCGASTRQLPVLCLTRRRRFRVSRSLGPWCCFLHRETAMLRSHSGRPAHSKMHSTRECGDVARFTDSKHTRFCDHCQQATVHFMVTALNDFETIPYKWGGIIIQVPSVHHLRLCCLLTAAHFGQDPVTQISLSPNGTRPWISFLAVCNPVRSCGYRLLPL